MLSLDFKKTISNFLYSAQTFAALFDAIAKISKYCDETTPYMLGLTQGGDKLNAAAAQIHSRYASLQQITREIVPQKVYLASGAFRQAVHDQLDTTVREHVYTETLVREVDQFVACYDGFLMEPSLQTSAALMLQASKDHATVTSFLGAFQLIEHALESTSENGEEETSISLVLSEVVSFADFTQKLQAFHDLYKELCFLMGTSEGTHPLRIVKIESGSLWIKVFGDTRVMRLLVALVESTVGYLHRRFTREGKIASVPRKLDSLDAAIQVTAKLQALGVDTSAINENLRKSGVAISRSLAELLEDQPRVRVNEHVFTVGPQTEPLFIAQRSTLRLRNESERIEPTLGNEDAGPSSEKQ